MLELEHISIRFGERHVLQSFSMHVNRGERVALTGPSGCGKSTVLRCLLGFVQPDAGAVRIDGESLSADSVWRLRARLAYVAQEPELGEGTAREALMRPFAFAANRDLRPDAVSVVACLHAFDLPPDVLDRPVRKLSGGEKQRVALVGALLLRRPILLLDEIVSALDDDSASRVSNYLQSQPGLTVVAAAHHAGAAPFATRALRVAGQGGTGP